MEHLMHVPTPLLLEHFSLDELCDIFRESTGDAPSGVVFSVFSAVGPNFESKLYRENIVNGGDRRRGSLREVANACRAKGLGLWLCFDTTMSFAASNATHIVDSKGNSARRCCIHARGTHKVLQLLAEEAKRAITDGDTGPEIAGIVLPAQDLWPMGATNNVIDVSCFCRYCATFYQSKGLDRLEEFSFYPSPLNLALRDTGTGIDHIHVFKSTTSAETLIQYSRAEQMLAAEWLESLNVYEKPYDHPRWPELQEKADRLLRLVNLRQELTVSSLESVASRLKEVFSSRVACIVEGLDYDWTGGYFLDHLVSRQWCDEVWLPPSAAGRVSGKTKRLYCCHRSAYVVGEFAAHIEAVLASYWGGTTAVDDQSGVAEQTRRIGRMLTSFVMGNPGDYVAMEDDSPSVAGIVVPAFVNKTVEKLLESVPAPKTTAEELLELMHAANRQPAQQG